MVSAGFNWISVTVWNKVIKNLHSVLTCALFLAEAVPGSECEAKIICLLSVWSIFSSPAAGSALSPSGYSCIKILTVAFSPFPSIKNVQSARQWLRGRHWIKTDGVSNVMTLHQLRLSLPPPPLLLLGFKHKCALMVHINISGSTGLNGNSALFTCCHGELQYQSYSFFSFIKHT